MNETDSANRHFGAMATENSNIERINAITEDPDSILLVVEGKKIKFIHSCKKFGGTRTNSTTTVACLIGQGAKAFPIVIDSENVATSKEVSVPSDTRIWACKDAIELRELDINAPTNPPPAASSGARTRSQRGAASTEETNNPPDATGTTAAPATGTQKYMAPPVFLPLPILGITALECISDDPLVLIEAIKIAAKNFNEAHKDSDTKFDDATEGAMLFMRWLYAAHKGLIEETRLSIEPDNVELLAYAEERYSKCILPSLEQIARRPHGIEQNESVLRQLIQATNRNNEVCEETNKIRQAEYDWKRDADEIKKDRTKDLHPSIKLMIENASATVCDNEGELGEKFLSLYNMKTHGGLDIELHQLFEDKGMGDVGFAEGVATNMWAGIFTRTQKSTPGAFSPFSFSEQTALSTKSDKDRSLLLEIYSSTKGGLIKSIDGVKSSAKTTVTVPQDFHSLLYQLKAFTFAVGFVFGEDSILATKLLDFVEKVDKNSIIYKNRIADENTFAAKILWSVDCYTQLFLEDCCKCLDREDHLPQVGRQRWTGSKERKAQGGLQRKRRRSKEQAEEVFQSCQRRSDQRVQDGRRRDLGGNLPRKMSRKKSEMDGHIRVPHIPHQGRVLRQELQVCKDAPPSVCSSSGSEDRLFGVYGMLQEDGRKHGPKDPRIGNQVGT